jgi:hypothetical protein
MRSEQKVDKNRREVLKGFRADAGSLDKAKKGIDMNLLAFRSPDRIYYSDSCPAGLGGYSDEGYAWRFKVPDKLRFRASNNLLEFLAAVITSWIDIIGGRL